MKYIGKCRVIYDKKTDSYRLELKRNGSPGWSLAMIANCRSGQNGESNLIHYSFLVELLRTVSNGFELIN